MTYIPLEKWLWLCVSCGLSSFLCYFLAAFAPLPDSISLILAFAFGPLFMLSSMGLFHVIKARKDSIALRIGGLFNIVGAAVVTMMLVVQITIQNFHQQYKVTGSRDISDEELKWIFKEVNSVQLGMDVTWDIFISSGTFFLALTIFKHPQMNKLLAVLGMTVSLLLLVFNLFYFPEPPAGVDSIDFGPFVALWYIVLMALLVFKRKSLILETR